MILITLISYASEPPPAGQIVELTFGSVTDEQRAENRASWGRGEVIATVVLGLVLGVYLYLYLYFSFWL